MKIKRVILVIILILFFLPFSFGQRRVRLTLQSVIEMANDSSLAAFRYENMYLSGYWGYRSYKANRLPSLTLDLTPARYYKYITERYDSEADKDVYRAQEMFNATAGLNIRQNLDITGGTFYVDSELDYMRSMGEDQFSSIPVRIGYEQELIGYNEFKWERKIEPLKYEIAKREFVYNTEQISEEAVECFFALVMAKANYELALENVASCDTLCKIGERRLKIASISQADLLTLKLDRVNARNALENAGVALKRANVEMASFLNMEKGTVIELEIPEKPGEKLVNADRAVELAKMNNPTYLKQQYNILEAEKSVDKTKKEAMFNAAIDASFGFNQVANKFFSAYENLLNQNLVSVSISIPLLDWGVRRGKYNMAKNILNVTKISARQEEIKVEEEVTTAVVDFNIQQNLIKSAEEALELSQLAYNQTVQRFITGKADINSLTLAMNRQQEAQKNYVYSLQNYWLNYYKIRKLTLYDFEKEVPLADSFDFDRGFYK